MATDFELDMLRNEEQAAFRNKQAAWQRWHDAKDRTNAAYDRMQEAWTERCDARDEMNREFDAMQSERARNDAVWADYARIRDANNAQIETLKSSADYEHQQMISCFEQASYAYESGDKASAPLYSQEGHEHQARRDELNDEIRSLGREVKDAKADAQMRAPKVDDSSFRIARDRFNRAKSRHQDMTAEFKQSKDERNQLRVEFERLKDIHAKTKALYEAKRKQLRDERDAKKRTLLNKIDMELSNSDASYLGSIFGQNAKIRPRHDGSGAIDVFFGGANIEGDGYGHGHAVIDRYGNVTYLRDAGMEHDDYLIDDRPKDGINTHLI